MMSSLGKNTLAGEELRQFVERVESIRERKKHLSEDEALVMAEAKARGFVTAAIKYVVKVRAMKPHDRAEAESLRDLYLHAMGLDTEPPLFRAINLIDADIHAKESILEAMKQFVPAGGEITVKVGGTHERLWREKDGTVHVEPVELKHHDDPVDRRKPVREKPPVPDVDDTGAVELGKQAARDNRPIIDNPFPFGDSRRPRFDEGWRSENGGDGMGPEDDD